MAAPGWISNAMELAAVQAAAGEKRGGGERGSIESRELR
jgi:hypothetical protein